MMLDQEDIYSDAYNEGRVAYLAGEPLTRNPYGQILYDRRFFQWSGGWHCELDIALASASLEQQQATD